MRRDDGMTLIEMLVAMSISGVVLASIVAALGTAWRVQEQVLDTTTARAGSQLAAIAFADDVAGASRIAIAGTRGCRANAATITVPLGGSPQRVRYEVRPEGGAWALVRTVAGPVAGGVPDSRVVASGLASPCAVRFSSGPAGATLVLRTADGFLPQSVTVARRTP